TESPTATPTESPTATSPPSATPTLTATPTPTLEANGPVVLFLGVLARFDGCVFCCEPECATTPTPTPGFDEQGRRVYEMASGQFVIVVEGAAGASGFAPGRSLRPIAPDGRPDLQIESTRDLGKGSAQVCDTGGVPGINPPDFSADDLKL